MIIKTQKIDWFVSFSIKTLVALIERRCLLPFVVPCCSMLSLDVSEKSQLLYSVNIALLS